jgi:hypothetical protein
MSGPITFSNYDPTTGLVVTGGAYQVDVTDPGDLSTYTPAVDYEPGLGSKYLGNPTEVVKVDPNRLDNIVPFTPAPDDDPPAAPSPSPLGPAASLLSDIDPKLLILGAVVLLG